MPAGAFHTPRVAVGAGEDAGDRAAGADGAQPVVVERVGDPDAREVERGVAAAQAWRWCSASPGSRSRHHVVRRVHDEEGPAPRAVLRRRGDHGGRLCRPSAALAPDDRGAGDAQDVEQVDVGQREEAGLGVLIADQRSGVGQRAVRTVGAGQLRRAGDGRGQAQLVRLDVGGAPSAVSLSSTALVASLRAGGEGNRREGMPPPASTEGCCRGPLPWRR